MKKILIFIITGLRPMLGPARCVYDDVGCTEFAMIQLEQKNIFAALRAIVGRIALCNPIGFLLIRDKS